MTSAGRHRLPGIFAALVIFATPTVAAATEAITDTAAANQTAAAATKRQAEEATADAQAARAAAPADAAQAQAQAAQMQAQAVQMRAQAAQMQATGQTLDFLSKGTFASPVVMDAPYSAEAVTTVSQTLGDGTRIKRLAIAKVYRDRAGRVRREQTLLGLAAINPSNDSQPVVIINDPIGGMTSVLDASTHVARQTPINGRSLSASPVRPAPPATRSGPPAAPSPHSRGSDPDTPPVSSGALAPAGKEEALGTRRIEGVTAFGRRIKITIPAGRIGNDRPLEIADEQWESPDLNVVILSRHHDPRTGDVEYRLTQINRVEPPRDLFTVPSDYTIVDASIPRRATVPTRP
jgi:hypothetical protein